MLAIARRLLLVAAICGFIADCSSSSGAVVSSVREHCPSADDDYFFPRGVLDKDNPESDLFSRNWYSESLRRMGEPSLSCVSEGYSETYRFLWLRTFAHPISVRINQSQNKIEIEAYELSGAGGYDPGTIAKHIRKTVSFSEWERLRSAFARVDFWNLPTKDSRLGADGAEWIIEGRRDKAYHVVDRWSPEGHDRDVGLMFLDLAGFSTIGMDVY